MDKIRTDFKGKVDRLQEGIVHGQHGRFIDMMRSIKTYTNTEKIIMSDWPNSRIPIDNYHTINNIINCRHNLWVDCIHSQTKMSNENFFQDVDINQTIDQINNMYNLNMPDPCINVSPDYLIVSKVIGKESKIEIFFGDIAITTNEDFTIKKKNKKYRCVLDFFESQGINTTMCHAIIQKSLTNLEKVFTILQSKNIIKISKLKINRCKDYHRVCEIMIENLLSNVDNKEQLKSMLTDKYDDSERTNPDIKITLPEQYKYTNTEDEIINWVKVKTDENFENYYDQSIDDTKLGFNKVRENYKNLKKMTPKSTLKVVHNSSDHEDSNGHDLINDYVNDLIDHNNNQVNSYILSLLPSRPMLREMKKIKDENSKSTTDQKKLGVFGPWQYTIKSKSFSPLYNDFCNKIKKGKNDKNDETEPRTIDPMLFNIYSEDIENDIEHLGEISKKKPVVNDGWYTNNTDEEKNTADYKKIYDTVRQTNGVQLGFSLSHLFQRLTHIKIRLSMRDNIYTPPNSSFIAVIPKEHTPLNSSNCDVPLIFITRIKHKGSSAKPAFEYEYLTTTSKYTYYISKLCRLNLDKMANWDQVGYKIIQCCSFLGNMSKKMTSSKRLCGIISMLSLDIHQKTSEYLELIKYISYMPFAQLSRLSKLIVDKFGLLMKTKLDCWIFTELESFIYKLANFDFQAKKNKYRVSNANIIYDSLGLKITMPSFINKDNNHDNIENFIEEMSMLFIVRGKHLYGSQFLDKSTNNTAQWNVDYEKECIEHGNWVKTGINPGVDYPFDAKFAFSSDAIEYAKNHSIECYNMDQRTVLRELSKGQYNGYVHEISTLRGCTKEVWDRIDSNDIHSTSMDECLKYYSQVGYDDSECKIINCAKNGLEMIGYISDYSMSEKNQRGAGRPIATPTLRTKCINYCIEKPEQAIGKCMKNNILVEGRNKLDCQSQTYQGLLKESFNKFNCVYQCTEDQSKFSENDNCRKYINYIKYNQLLPNEVRDLQLKCLEKMEGRQHLVKRYPKSIIARPELNKYGINMQTGIRAIIGWPQGMLNNLSTSIHAFADLWILHAYNKAYPNNKVNTKGLVHSDDSWYTISCNCLKDFTRFSVFRTYAKRLFCLKMNDKKIWGSKYLGELVSNFNVNGHMVTPISKIVSNCFNNLLYQSWPLDVSSQVSSIQQALRQGATIGTIICMWTLLRHQIKNCYNIIDLKTLNDLPIEMGGYPDASAFELAVCGLKIHDKNVHDKMKEYDSNRSIISDLELSKLIAVLKACTYSKILIAEKINMERQARENLINNLNEAKMTNIKIDNDLLNRVNSKYNYNLSPIGDLAEYMNITTPEKAELFYCIKHILPRSKKISKTIESILSIPRTYIDKDDKIRDFSSDGLEMLITRPDNIDQCLGHIKNQCSGMLYGLASEHYTQTKRRLAVNQAIKSSGKIVKLSGGNPCMIHELIEQLRDMDIPESPVQTLEVAFTDDTRITDLCGAITKTCKLFVSYSNKVKKTNRMPKSNDKFDTRTNIKDVLLKIIDLDDKNTNYYEKYGTIKYNTQQIYDDIDLIKARFKTYFDYYSVKQACNYIMQQYIFRVRFRLWVQPELSTYDLKRFICDLYGKTINQDINYKVSINVSKVKDYDDSNEIIDTLYTCLVLNNTYIDKFDVKHVVYNHQTLSIKDFLRKLDYGLLTKDIYKKYAALQIHYNEEMSHAREIDISKDYRQYWNRKQCKDIFGRYTGSFSVICSMGNTAIQIDGQKGNCVITANNSNINTIMKIMKEFLYTNFGEKMNHHGEWGKSDFFRTITYNNFSPSKNNNNKIQDSIGTFLYYWNESETTIDSFKENNPNRVKFNININLNTVNVQDTITDRAIYKLNHTKRKILRVNPNKIDTMICSIRHSFNIGNIDNIQLKESFVGKFMNTDLLKTRVITQLATNSFKSSEIGSFDSLLTPEITTDSYFYRSIMSMISNLKGSSFIVPPVIGPSIIQEVIELDTMTVDELDVNLPIAPEAIDCIIVANETKNYSEQHRMMKYDDLTMPICKAVSSPMTMQDRLLFCKAFNRKDVVNKLKDIAKMIYQDDEMSPDELLSIAGNDLMDKNLFCFIVSNELHDPDTWNNAFKDRPLAGQLPVINPKYIHYYNAILNKMEILFYGEEHEENDDYESD